MRTISATACALVTLSPKPLYAHDGRPLAPHDVWGAWTFDAAIVVSLAIIAILYAAGTRALAERASPYGRLTRRRRTAAFVLGWSVLVVSLVSPLHAMGEVLFFAHMIQHELLVAVAAPLVVMSRPFVRAVWALPDRARHLMVTVTRMRLVHSTWELVCHPAIAWTLHAAALWLWHLPGLYEQTLSSDLAHAAQHASFLGTALLFWWSLVRVRARRGV
ncbi:MAG: cytochrome c oxidase assembly protein, partial [Gemmatimonadota bacterium]|nr:cytochrome c oxidase assembly protein [Gemmatimonadota bacterium]